MSTVQKNETAANSLPIEQKKGFLRFLAIRLRKDPAQPQHRRRNRKFSSFQYFTKTEN